MNILRTPEEQAIIEWAHKNLRVVHNQNCEHQRNTLKGDRLPYGPCQCPICKQDEPSLQSSASNNATGLT